MKTLPFTLIVLCIGVRASAQTIASYQAVVTSQTPSHYFKLDNSLVDAAAGPALTQAGGAFANDFFGTATSAFSYSAATDMLQTGDIINGGGAGANAAATGVGALTFLFRTLSDTNNSGQRFIFSQGHTSTSRNQFELFFENLTVANGDPNCLKLRVGNGPTTAILQVVDIVPSSWYYFAMDFDETRNVGEIHWYLGRVGSNLLSGIIDIGNDGVVGDNGTFYIGNRDTGNSAFRSPGNGFLDEIATWTRELTEEEINNQFNALSGVTPPASSPTLHITLAGSNVLIAWPTNGTDGFNLETSAVLPAVSWSPAGSPSIVDTNNVVTLPASATQSFFRLNHP